MVDETLGPCQHMGTRIEYPALGFSVVQCRLMQELGDKAVAVSSVSVPLSLTLCVSNKYE